MATDGFNLSNQFLIAMPGMLDDSFAGTVVYLCERSERGALGLGINKRIDINLKNLFDKVDLSLQRQRVKRLIMDLEVEHPGVKQSMLRALGNVAPRHLLDTRLNPPAELRRRVAPTPASRVPLAPPA